LYGFLPIKIVSNQFQPTYNNEENAGVMFTGNNVLSDQYSSIQLVAAAATSVVRVFVRDGTHSTTAYACQMSGALGSSQTMVLGKFIYDTVTPLTSFVATPNVGDILEVSAVGSTVTCKLNGVVQTSITDTSYAGGSPGFTIFDSVSAGNAIADNWDGGNYNVTHHDWRIGGSPNFFGGVTVGGGSLLLTSDVPPAYNHSGTIEAAPHIVRDTCTLGTSCSITLTGSAVFSGTTYDCFPRDVTTPANAVTVTITSGNALAFTGTGTDVVNYVCVGH
jgi:hypothetical protein